MTKHCKTCNTKTDRYKTTGICKPCHKAAMARWQAKNREHLRDYNRQWRKDNPDKYAQQRARYFQRKVEELSTD